MGGLVIVLLLAGLAVSLAAIVQLVRRLAAARNSLASQEQARKDLQVLLKLTRVISGSDWQRSVQALLAELVSQQYATATRLLALTESGQLEARAATPPQPDDGAVDGDPLVQAALQTRAEQLDPATGRACLPIHSDGELLGFLLAEGACRRNAGASELALLRAACDLSGVALTSLRAFQRQSTISSTDGLTGLFNHRHFQGVLGVELAQTYLQGYPLTLLLFDIDHFKMVNDTYGHLFGDLVLREVAGLTREVCPSIAVVARYGGEEVAVILPRTDVEAAATVAEQLRAAIACNQVVDPLTGTKVAVTVSIGLAAYQLGQGKGRLIARADQAMYASKRGGRNRATIALPDEVMDVVEPWPVG